MVHLINGTSPKKLDKPNGTDVKSTSSKFANLKHPYDFNTDEKDATWATRKVLKNFRSTLNFEDGADFDQANKGFIAREENLVIRDKDHKAVWNLKKYKKFIAEDDIKCTTCPSTVNPSLYRNAQLNLIDGLFKVLDGDENGLGTIYQVRGYDLSNITFVRGETGWICFDPLISNECAKAAFDLLNANVPEEDKNKDIKCLIYSHSHIDHYGGAGGLVTKRQVEEGEVVIIASDGFTEHAVSENVIAGNAMSRRAIYMYGSMLPKEAKGQVSGGLGMTTSTGTTGLIPPTDIIYKTGEVRTIDGVEMVFQFTPGTEAPTEMNTWFPDTNALWMAENTTCTMHNLLTLRGAVVRDALKWAEYLTETIDMWGKKAVVKFQAHHWPLWGTRKIVTYLNQQRDVYKFLHDQSVRLLNRGFTGPEIAEMIRLPDKLYKEWSCRGYYGTTSHNTKAVYQRYMGWYTGNPSDLHEYPPVQTAERYVDMMGGEEAIITKCVRYFRRGDYRWVAQVLKHVVFFNENNMEARYLLADALEQLGYQAESGPWRGEYLTGAKELRFGVPSDGGIKTTSPDVIANMDPGMLFDFMGVRLRDDKASALSGVVQVVFTDLQEIYTLTLENCVLSYSKAPKTARVNATAVLSKTTLNMMINGHITPEQAKEKGLLTVGGDAEYFDQLFAIMDHPALMFNIVTPREPDTPNDEGNEEGADPEEDDEE